MDSEELPFRFAVDLAQEICFDIKGIFFFFCINIIPSSYAVTAYFKKLQTNKI